VIAAQADQLAGNSLGELLADELDHLRALGAAIEIIPHQDDSVLVVELGDLGDGLFEGAEIAVDVADRERAVRHGIAKIPASGHFVGFFRAV
jgi:hypothetical protein